VFERYVARIRRVTGGGGEQVICGLLPIRRVMSNKLKKIKDGYITEARKMTKGKFWLWFARIATVIGLITGGLALYDYLSEDQYTIEQSVDPETMKRLRELNPGETINVEKGRPSDDTGS